MKINHRQNTAGQTLINFSEHYQQLEDKFILRHLSSKVLYVN